MSSLSRALAVAALALAIPAAVACTPVHQYGYQAAEGGPERALPAVHAQVITAEAAAGRAGRPLVIGFGDDGNGTQLVSDFLARADEAGAAQVSDLAIYLGSERDGQRLECRTEIVPETVTRSQWQPPTTEIVSVYKPVTRTVTEYERQCSMVSRSESRMVTEYERQCQTRSRPVTRTRTTYSGFGADRSPRTETYTSYESSYECDSRPVTRYRTETVPKQECHSRPVTRTVTSYEFQRESRYVPGRMETISRQRLRELDPVCYPVEAATAAPGAGGGNRIEGTLHDR